MTIVVIPNESWWTLPIIIQLEKRKQRQGASDKTVILKKQYEYNTDKQRCAKRNLQNKNDANQMNIFK